MRIITEMSLRELTELMIKAQEDESAVATLFVNPRRYFLQNNIVIPMDAEIKIQHRDELRAQLLTPVRFEKFAADMREDEAAITIHIKKPLQLRCGRITIKCPKKNQGKRRCRQIAGNIGRTNGRCFCVDPPVGGG